MTHPIKDKETTMRDLLIICRMGLPMLAKFIWIVLGVVGIGVALKELLQLDGKVPAWLFVFSIIIALSIGLLLYFGQRSITQSCNKHNEYLESYLNIERSKVEKLEHELRKFKED